MNQGKGGVVGGRGEGVRWGLYNKIERELHYFDKFAVGFWRGANW